MYLLQRLELSVTFLMSAEVFRRGVSGLLRRRSLIQVEQLLNGK